MRILNIGGFVSFYHSEFHFFEITFANMAMRIVCVLSIWIGCHTASGQLRINARDSGWLTRNMVDLEAVFSDKKGNVKQFGPGKNDIPFKKINWEYFNCKALDNHSVYFDRAEVLKKGGEIRVIAKYKNKYKDTLVITLPKPVRIEFGDTVQHFLVNDFVPLKGRIYFSDGKQYIIQNHTAFQLMLNIETPEGMLTYAGMIKVTVDVFMRKKTLKICVDGFKDVCNTVQVQPDYNYILSLNDVASKGRDGFSGPDGLDGCENCSDRGVDGQNGGEGQAGYNGYNANNMEIWLKHRYDSITMVKVKNPKYGEVIYYIDLYHAGKIYVYLGGGDGGAGGKGGKGGAGLDEINGKGPGQGGNGGRGGDGGDGGNGGSLTVYTDTASYGLYTKISLFNAGGYGGAAGEGGKSGRGGRKENAGIIGTLVTGRRGDEGTAGNQGHMGSTGGEMVVRMAGY